MTHATSTDDCPPDPPPWFWHLIDEAKRGPGPFRAALDALSQEQVARAYAYFSDLARIFCCTRYVSRMHPDTTEDGSHDTGFHIVAQGREHFRDVYQHADKVPSGPEPGTKAERMLPGDIIEFYRDKFGEDLPDIQSEYPDEGP